MLLFFQVDAYKKILDVVSFETLMAQRRDYTQHVVTIPYLVDEDHEWEWRNGIGRAKAIGQHLYMFADRRSEELRKLRT